MTHNNKIDYNNFFIEEETDMSDQNPFAHLLAWAEKTSPTLSYTNKIKDIINATYNAVAQNIMDKETALAKLKESVLFQIDELFNPPE